MPIEEIQNIVKNINGFLDNNEGVVLFNLAKVCKAENAIIEIGSWRGTSTIWLGKGSQEGNQAKVYAVDPHTGSFNPDTIYIEHQDKKLKTFEEFTTNIKNAKVNHLVVPLVMTSTEAARNFDKPVGLIFIDGAHEYELVRLDFDLWFPKVIDGGIMAFHDSVSNSFPGPKKVVDNMVYKSKYFKNINVVNSLTFAQKVEMNSMKDRIQNRYRLFSKNIYILADTLHLPKSIRSIGKKIVGGLLHYGNAKN